ncbi:glycosyltransferase family 2 protein [uncultured Alistipes sp.]|jgi:putative glycosyltransferase epsH|uniref:glycosyltransferase family 2 protein n=1 Tax=uncultured Alistipes sp. TaxID=538949 RepID=UPI0025D545EE|nr:glycosyltransferase family 2 protein [uncultured Alistipes sp.]
MENKVKLHPVVTVVVPVYNLEKYIDTCLNSLLQQTFTDFEAIVVDDGSTDATEEVLRRYAQQDARIVAVTSPNQGVARARELAVSKARGKYICFLDGDDFFEPRMLEEMTAAIAVNGGYDIVCCDYMRVRPSYTKPVRSDCRNDMNGLEYLMALLSSRIWGGVWGKLYRRELFESEIRHHPLRLWQDLSVNLQIASSRPRVHFIDYIGYGYVQRAGSSNHSKLDFAYCLLFCETIEREIMLRAADLDGQAEFCVLLNNFRTYMVYLRKSHTPWEGDHPFVRNLRQLARRYRNNLKYYYSRVEILLLKLDRYKLMRPAVIAISTMMRWRISLQRRLAR